MKTLSSKLTALVVALIFAVTLAGCGGGGESPTPAQRIPSDAFLWNGHYYYVYNGCSSWEDAELYCESLGGHLAVITSSAENQAVYSYIRSLGLKDAFFGYAKNTNNGAWYWVDGTKSSYENWHSGEPNNEYSSEYYAMFYHKFADGTWNDGNFEWNAKNGAGSFICEWD